MFRNFWLKPAPHLMRGLNQGIEDRLYGFIPPLLLIYIFFQPFNHFAGIKNTAFILMSLLFLIKITKKGINIHWKDSAIIALFILGLVILMSIFLSNYVIDSLNAFRKNFLYQTVAFFVIVTEFHEIEKLKALLHTVIVSFITVTLIIFIKNPPANLFNILEVKAQKETFLRGYALNAAFYVPFTIGYLFSTKDRLSIKAFYWFMLLAEFVLVWLYYSSRTTLAAVLAAGVIMIVMSKRYKMLLAMLIVFLGVGIITYFKKPELLERHKTLLYPATYMTNEGLSGRLGIWKGTIDMIKDRPLLGYGYGWKKIAIVAREEGYLERWKEKWPDTYDFFEKGGYGRASPHNLILQILFEVGILGLLAFMLFWATVFLKITGIIKKGCTSELSCFVKYGVLGVLVAYSIINITNSLWEETYGVLTFALSAITVVIYEQNRYKGN